MTIAPKATGIRTKERPLPPRIAIIGLAPAGGWIESNVAITKTARPTATPREINEEPINKNIMTPLKADNVWPKNIFFGSANGLSWTAITKTMLAPKGGINHISPYSEKCKYESKLIHKKAPNADNKFSNIVFLLKKFFIIKD